MSASTTPPPRSRLISRVLGPAIRLWLRSQVEGVESLELSIDGGDRQILTGYVPGVQISAKQLVYQGIHISEANLTGQNIRVNLSQVLRGKALQLLEPIMVVGQINTNEANLNTSLSNTLLQKAVQELLHELLQDHEKLAENWLCYVGKPVEESTIVPMKITLQAEQLILDAKILAHSDLFRSISISTGLKLTSSRHLDVQNPNLTCYELIDLHPSQVLFSAQLDSTLIDLGSEVAITHLLLAPNCLELKGRIQILP